VKKIIPLLLLSFGILSAPTITVAETVRYVTDKLEIPLRSGQGTQFGIRKMLPSGSKLEVLEIDPAGYSNVRTAKGTDGWVLTRYLSNTGSAKDRLAASEQKVVNLELDLAKANEELQTLSTNNNLSGSENISLKKDTQRLTKELDDLHRTASSAVALQNNNRKLREELQQIEHQIQSLIIENSGLKESDTKFWFLIGAAVLLAGILLGIILPRLRFQKKNSWNQF